LAASVHLQHRRPEILVVCASEVILYGVTGLLGSAGYAVRGFADAWRARKLLASHRFDLAVIGSTGLATSEFLEHLARCTPPVKVLVLDGISASGLADLSKRSSGAVGPTLLSTVAQLIGVPDPPSGSPGPTAA
jgi:hypothetical protein